MRVIIYRGFKPVVEKYFRNWLSACSYFDRYYDEKYYHMVMVRN